MTVDYRSSYTLYTRVVSGSVAGGRLRYNAAMVVQYDLHSHSTASDGTLAPRELVACAARAGVGVLALTDHDTLEGISAAQFAAAEYGLQFVPGIEISVTWQRRTVHILGLHVDPGNRQLRAGLQVLQSFRRWRAEEIGRRLEKSGITGTYSAASVLSAGGMMGRTHFARVLLREGHGKSLQKVFKRFLVRDKPGYVPGEWATLDDAVHWIRAAGGQAVIAHPARYRLTASKLTQLVEEFRECSGTALEVVSGSHSAEENYKMARFAMRHQLLGSQGSDYHGPEKRWVQLGKLPGLPADCPPIWGSDWWRAQSAAANNAA